MRSITKTIRYQGTYADSNDHYMDQHKATKVYVLNWLLGTRKWNKYHVRISRANMECAVYDTYVTKKDGRIMHFDVVVDADTPHEKAIEYGKEYLSEAGQDGQKMTQEECQFCHIQEAPPFVEKNIKEKGYWIQKMEGCPS